MNKAYIINDADGNPINGKYPPDKEKNGKEFGGYKSETEKIIFHDFAVLKQNISFRYNDCDFRVYYKEDGIYVYWDILLPDFQLIVKEDKFLNAIDFIDNFKIEENSIVDIIDCVEYAKVLRHSIKPYLAYDKNGYPYNSKYPPNKEKFGDLYDGYKNWAEEVLFHRFGVLCYDVSFVYKGKHYYLLKEPDHAAVCDEHYTTEYEVYANEMELIENFKIDGKPLITLIEEIEEIDSE